MRLGWRDQFAECLSFGGTAGVASGALILLYRSGFASGDVFSLAGALIGAGSAVAGAIWLADRQQERAHRRECDILRHVVVTVQARLQPAIALLDKRFDENSGWRAAIDDFYGSSSDAPELFSDALEKASTLDLRERLTIRKLKNGLVEFRQLYRVLYDENTEDDGYRGTPINKSLPKLDGLLGEALEALDFP